MDIGLLKQLSELGMVGILLSIIAGLGWYMVKIREPHEKNLEEAIKRISIALQQIADTNDKTLNYLHSHTAYLQMDLGTKLSELKSNQTELHNDVMSVSNKLDLLILKDH